MKQFGFIALLLSRYSQSLICYDCYDTGPSNERCIRSKNCTGEACLLYEGADVVLTTAFCLLNLPDQYRKRTRTNDGVNSSAQCWLEADGKGKHCICSQNFCNKLRDRRLPMKGDTKLPLENAIMVERNPLIDYDDNSDIDPPFIHDLKHPDSNEDTIAIDASEDLVPIGIENYDYEDDLELRVPVIPPTLPPTLPLPWTEYPPPASNNHATTLFEAATQPNTQFHTAVDGNKSKLPVDIFATNIIFPDKLLHEIKQNTFAKVAPSSCSLSIVCLVLIFFLILFFNFY